MADASESMLSVEVWRGAEKGAFQTFQVPRRAHQTILDVVTDPGFYPPFLARAERFVAGVRDAIEVMERLRGRPENALDRVLRLAHRLIKFSRHPQRTLRQRWYFWSTLRRWSL